MALIKWTPFFEPLLDIERAFDVPAGFGFAPLIDLYESGDDLIADIALAGIDPKDVSVSIEDTILTIEGGAHKKTEIDEKNYYRKEVRGGSFHRAVHLPTAVNAEKTTARYTKGMLKITMPKKGTSRPARISITVDE